MFNFFFRRRSVSGGWILTFDLDGKILLRTRTNKQMPERNHPFLVNKLLKLHSAHQQESVEIA